MKTNNEECIRSSEISFYSNNKSFLVGNLEKRRVSESDMNNNKVVSAGLIQHIDLVLISMIDMELFLISFQHNYSGSGTKVIYLEYLFYLLRIHVPFFYIIAHAWLYT